jgi:DNA-binding NarL/FixJ family response regulator
LKISTYEILGVSVLRVLIVDDNESFLETLEKFVSTFPNVEIAGKAVSGEQAVKMCSKLKPDLVLMDIKMPGLNGFEAARIIKSMDNPPRILLLSFNDHHEYQAEAVSAGADGYLAKSEINSGLLRQISSIFSISSGAAS